MVKYLHLHFYTDLNFGLEERVGAHEGTCHLKLQEDRVTLNHDPVVSMFK